MIGHLLNRTLAVWRPTTVDDGAGGQETTYVHQGDVRAKADQPSAAEQMLAAQARSSHSHNVYLLPSAEVDRGDQLRGDNQTFRVLAVVQPSTARYSKAQCELIQSQGA